jgi:hypothetical protein
VRTAFPLTKFILLWIRAMGRDCGTRLGISESQARRSRGTWPAIDPALQLKRNWSSNQICHAVHAAIGAMDVSCRKGNKMEWGTHLRLALACRQIAKA